MKKIQYFKLFESRTAELSEEEFNKIIREKCSDYINNPLYLQRVKRTFDGDYTYINPKLHIRNPLVASEESDPFGGDVVFSKHHTLLMENLPSWNNFSKRSESIIFSTKPEPNTIFGKYFYYVIPYDGAKFSVAPKGDLWQCKAVIKPRSTFGEKYSFNDAFSERMVDSNISDNSYEEMISDLNKLFEDYNNGSSDWLDVSKFFGNIFDKMNEDGYTDVAKALNNYFDPNNFETPFETMDYNSLTNIDNTKDREVWTDSECLLVFSCAYKYGSMMYDELNSNFNEFIKLL